MVFINFILIVMVKKVEFIKVSHSTYVICQGRWIMRFFSLMMVNTLTRVVVRRSVKSSRNIKGS
jgi:hypothetical protein